MLHIGKEIRSVDDWFKLAPPKKGTAQWKDRRSAKELAKAWFPASGNPNVPSELRTLLDSRKETRNIAFDRGEPERVTRFDRCGGEGRNADLVLWGRCRAGKVLVSIEAKADESFGETAGEYMQKAVARNPRSRVPDRFDLLCRGLLGVTQASPAARHLRYQLLTGVAGALAEAQACGADITVFVVHEFIGSTNPVKVAANAADLNAFVSLLSNRCVPTVSPGSLCGPFSVPGNAHFAGTNRLFIGKCRRFV